MSEQTEAARKSIGARRNLESAEAILEAAESVLLEGGYAGFSIEAVARRARAGKPTIYRWWPSKAALLLEVYQRQKRDVVFPDNGPLEEDLLTFLKSLLRQWRETPTGEIFRSIIAEAQTNADARAALTEYTLTRRVSSGRIVERAIARGEISDKTDPTVVTALVSSYAWVHLLINQLDEEDPRHRQAMNAIVKGLKGD